MKYSSIRYFARQCYDHAMMRGVFQLLPRDGIICTYDAKHNAVLVNWGEGYRVIDVPKSWMGL